MHLILIFLINWPQCYGTANWFAASQMGGLPRALHCFVVDFEEALPSLD